MSAFTKTSIRILTTTLLVGLFPSVSADCTVDWLGYESCDAQISTGAIVGICVGCFFLFLVVALIVWACLKRRGPAETNVVFAPQAQSYLPQAQPGTTYLPQVQPGTGVVYGSPHSPVQPSFTPQYPVQAQRGVGSPHGNNPSSGFAPGTG